MAAPTLLQRVADSLAVTMSGGVRVRVLADGSGVVRGRTTGPPPERLLRTVLELEPQGPGTVDLVSQTRGRWRASASGALAEPRFQQRRRNVLGNALA